LDSILTCRSRFNIYDVPGARDEHVEAKYRLSRSTHVRAIIHGSLVPFNETRPTRSPREPNSIRERSEMGYRRVAVLKTPINLKPTLYNSLLRSQPKRSTSRQRQCGRPSPRQNERLQHRRGMEYTAAGGLGARGLVLRCSRQLQPQHNPAPPGHAVLCFAAVLWLTIDSNIHGQAFVDPVPTGSVPF
jgi:hypothetical protein